MVPLVDLKAQYLSIKEELDEAVAGVISRATFIEGEEVALFEREFANYKRRPGISSGRAFEVRQHAGGLPRDLRVDGDGQGGSRDG